MLDKYPSPLLLQVLNMLVVVVWLSTKGTRARVAASEPFEQASTVEHVLACLAAFRWQLPGFVDDRVADRTFDVPLKRAGNVLAPRRESINNTTVLFAKVSA